MKGKNYDSCNRKVSQGAKEQSGREREEASGSFHFWQLKLTTSDFSVRSHFYSSMSDSSSVAKSNPQHKDTDFTTANSFSSFENCRLETFQVDTRKVNSRKKLVVSAKLRQL